MARALGRHLQQSQIPGMQGSYQKRVVMQAERRFGKSEMEGTEVCTPVWSSNHDQKMERKIENTSEYIRRINKNSFCKR